MLLSRIHQKFRLVTVEQRIILYCRYLVLLSTDILLYHDVFCNGSRTGVDIIMIITVNNEIMLRIPVTIKGLRKCNL